MTRSWTRVALLIGGTIAMSRTSMDTAQGQTGSAAGADAGVIRPFKVHYSDQELADLKRRIAATRWPD